MEINPPITMYGTYTNGDTFTMPVIDTEALTYFLHMEKQGSITIEKFDGEPTEVDNNSLFSRAAFDTLRKLETGFASAYLGDFKNGVTLDVNSLYPSPLEKDVDETIATGYRVSWHCEFCGETHEQMIIGDWAMIGGEIYHNMLSVVKDLVREGKSQIVIHANGESPHVWIDTTEAVLSHPWVRNV